MKYMYRNIRAKFEKPTENECTYAFYGVDPKQGDITLAEGKVTIGREVTDLSKTALSEFARKYIDVNYGAWYDKIYAPQVKEDLPLSEAAIKVAATAQAAANFIVRESCENTTSGCWIENYDEVAESIHTNADEVNRIADDICAVVAGAEEVADIELCGGYFDVTCYLDYCPNYEESPDEYVGNTIRALRVTPDKAPEVIFVLNDLAGLQSEVGGRIETVTLQDAAIIVNEEGKLMGLPPNRSYNGDILCGDFLICGTDEDDLCSLTDEQIEKYTQRFAEPEFSNPNMTVGLFGISM